MLTFFPILHFVHRSIVESIQLQYCLQTLVLIVEMYCKKQKPIIAFKPKSRRKTISQLKNKNNSKNVKIVFEIKNNSEIKQTNGNREAKIGVAID
jgi:hypothetical protein